MQPTTYPRRYLPDDFDAADLACLHACCDELEERPLPDAPALTQWIRDFDELRSAFREEAARRQVATSRDTGDAEAARRCRAFVRDVRPAAEARFFALDARLRDAPARGELDPDEFAEFLTDLEARRRIFRHENLPRQAAEHALALEYGACMGAVTVAFEGETRPLSRMKTFLDDPCRARREAAWRATWAAVREREDECEDLFERAFRVRCDIAAAADCDGYAAYHFLDEGRPYTPADCRAFHDAVAAAALPLQEHLLQSRRRALGVPALRPWDTGVDPGGRAPLRPFDDTRDLVALVRKAAGRIHPVFAERLSYMEGARLLDLDARARKRAGGFMCAFAERRLPFIFMNAAGLQADVTTLCHELGHALHVFEARGQRVAFNRGAPMEFAEVASMAFELMALDELRALDDVYGDAAYARVRREQLERVVRRFCWVATIDGFQLDLYERPAHTREERAALWLAHFRRFRGAIDYDGLADAERVRWHRQGHVFRTPLYYIEYALAQLGALQVWRNYRADPRAAVAAYRKALALGGSRPLPELFAAAGARFDVGPDLLGELMDFVGAELEDAA